MKLVIALDDMDFYTFCRGNRVNWQQQCVQVKDMQMLIDLLDHATSYHITERASERSDIEEIRAFLDRGAIGE